MILPVPQQSDFSQTTNKAEEQLFTHPLYFTASAWTQNLNSCKAWKISNTNVCDNVSLLRAISLIDNSIMCVGTLNRFLFLRLFISTIMKTVYECICPLLLECLTSPIVILSSRICNGNLSHFSDSYRDFFYRQRETCTQRRFTLELWPVFISLHD